MHSDRRAFFGVAAAGAGAIAGVRSAASASKPYVSKPGDGGSGLHAEQLPPGDPVAVHDAAASGKMPEFRYALDGSRPTVASGGWAKEVTAHLFPISKAMSGVHMFLNPGASRELHWHAGAGEWAFVIAGHCQTVVLTPSGASEINNFGPGDLWFFPKAHGHSIQTIGDEPCHFILSFDNGDTSPEHETFGITDWIDVTPKDMLALNFGVTKDLFDAFPKGEVYIQAGQNLSASQALDAPWPRESTHKFRLLHDSRAIRAFDGGTFRIATAAEWPISQPMSGGLITIRPGAMLGLHWHPNANEWNYVLRGKGRVALFGSGGRSRIAALAPGDAAYYPQGFGHAIENVGEEDLEIIQTWDNGQFQETSLVDWIKASPRSLLTNNFAGVGDAIIDKLKQA